MVHYQDRTVEDQVSDVDSCVALCRCSKKLQHIGSGNQAELLAPLYDDHYRLDIVETHQRMS